MHDIDWIMYSKIYILEDAQRDDAVSCVWKR